MKGKLLVSIAVSAMVGFAQWCWVLPFCWTYIAVYDPTSHWLIAHGMEGKTHLLVLFLHDAIINILLCLPAAFVLLRLRPRYPPLYITIAVLTGLLWDYRMIVIHPAVLSAGRGGMFVYGLLLALIMLPGAAALVRLWDRSRDGAR